MLAHVRLDHAARKCAACAGAACECAAHEGLTTSVLLMKMLMTSVLLSAGTIQIDAHTTMLSVSDILFTLLGFGFAVGSTIRVGQLLGAQRPAQAKLAGPSV